MRRRIHRSAPFAVTAIAAAVVGLPGTSALAAVDAASRQPLDAITAHAIEHLRVRHDDDPTLVIGGGELDDRLRLRRCDTPLETSIAPGSGDVGLVTVQVRCPMTSGWRVHVRLDVTRERTVWTFARAVRRGEVLGSDLLTSTRVSIGRGESRVVRTGVPIDALEPWLGQELVRDVAAGRPLVAGMLAPPRLVERGAEVRLRAGGSGLAIETVGEALADAALDERVPVRNRASGRVVEAIVTGRGRVEIRPGR